MRMKALAAACAAAVVALGGAAAIGAAKLPANIAAALADKGRPAADVQRDAARHPGELLAWAGVRPGMKVADFIMGGGYFTRILARAVGPAGHVWAFQPTEFIKFRAAYADEQKAAAAPYADVTPLTGPLVGLKLPEGLDLVLTVQNYHDMHLKAFPPETAAKADAEIFRALKPGGAFIVVDHVGPPDADTPDKLHRIDPAIIRKEVEATGFRFAGESYLLRNPQDPHDKLVFDPSIRGKTDQVAFKFVKPR